MPKREDIRFSNLGDEIEKHFIIMMIGRKKNYLIRFLS